MSYITEFIKNNPGVWEEKIKEKSITIHRDGNLAGFSYTLVGRYFPDFTDSVVQEARGIILDISDETNPFVVCWPFRKFGNWNESYVDTIDWNTAKVQEKIDGSIIKLYFYDGKWMFATNKTPNADKAEIEGLPGKSFGDIIRSAVNYSDVFDMNLDTDRTYIFELVSPLTRIVISYPETKLFLTGVRNNITGEEYGTDGYDFPKPKQYDCSDFDSCIRYMESMNKDGEEVENEGFVVVDGNFNRIKIKTSEYVENHHRMTGKFKINDLMQLILKDPTSLDDILSIRPEYNEPVEFYRDEILKFRDSFIDMVNLARSVYEANGKNRRLAYEAIRDRKLNAYAMKNLESDLTAEEVYNCVIELNVFEIINHIPRRKGDDNND